MKKPIIGAVIILATGLFAPQIVRGQGTLYLSSLSGTPTGNAPVGSDSWLAALFGTGNNPEGYMLNSVQLGMADASGSPNGFTVMIYTLFNGGSGLGPGSSLGTLTGSANPSTAGTYNYTAPSSLSLSPETGYFIVITSSTPVADGTYNWNESAYPPGVDSWGAVDNAIFQSSNGTSDWGSAPYLGIAQFAIYATPAPEPGVIGLFALGGLLLGFRRWKAKPV